LQFVTLFLILKTWIPARLSFSPTQGLLRSAKIGGKEFVGQLAKSDLFRNKYWSSLYVCKAIEFIHRKLLGRPTYGRQEMNPLFDLASKKGFYAVVDAILDSEEYQQAFGEDTVPSEQLPFAFAVWSRLHSGRYPEKK